jgi:UDP-N-acetyl-2-amino-2-deoxyglucuronate dehydrogenase
MEALKTAIVGCGKVGQLHAKALSQLSESVFVAVCDMDLRRVKQFAAQYGVKGYHDVEEMIAKSGVEVLTVCTPHPLHAESAIKAAKAGVHVLIEKPLASSLQDCDEILRAGKEGGVRIGTMCHPGVGGHVWLA